MMSDFIDSMWSLSQFHSNSIIIPQTPFSKGVQGLPTAETVGY
jgi:hypothetical protein